MSSPCEVGFTRADPMNPDSNCVDANNICQFMQPNEGNEYQVPWEDKKYEVINKVTQKRIDGQAELRQKYAGSFEDGNCVLSYNPNDANYRKTKLYKNCYTMINDGGQTEYPHGTCSPLYANLAELADIDNKKREELSYYKELMNDMPAGKWTGQTDMFSNHFSFGKDSMGNEVESVENDASYKPQVAVIVNKEDKDAPIPANQITGFNFR